MTRRILLFLFLSSAIGATDAEPLPKELIIYIQSANKAGLPLDEIRRNAAKAGWSSEMITTAFTASHLVQNPEMGANPSPSLHGDYLIGPGDVLSISVWKEPEASVPRVTVRADGRISVPLVKEVAVAGLKPSEAERLLGVRLSRYIHGADVTVIVNEIHSRKVYIVGGVRAVGAINLKGEMTVLQAITEAGGLTDYAKRKHIYVLRAANGKQVKLLFNYDAVIKGEKMGQNIILYAGDTVVVPQ